MIRYRETGSIADIMPSTKVLLLSVWLFLVVNFAFFDFEFMYEPLNGLRLGMWFFIPIICSFLVHRHGNTSTKENLYPILYFISCLLLMHAPAAAIWGRELQRGLRGFGAYDSQIQTIYIQSLGETVQLKPYFYGWYKPCSTAIELTYIRYYWNQFKQTKVICQVFPATKGTITLSKNSRSVHLSTQANDDVGHCIEANFSTDWNNVKPTNFIIRN